MSSLENSPFHVSLKVVPLVLASPGEVPSTLLPVGQISTLDSSHLRSQFCDFCVFLFTTLFFMSCHHHVMFYIVLSSLSPCKSHSTNLVLNKVRLLLFFCAYCPDWLIIYPTLICLKVLTYDYAFLFIYIQVFKVLKGQKMLGFQKVQQQKIKC